MSKQDRPRFAGPAKCPRPCGECKGAPHHFSDAMIESGDSDPEHPAAKAGVETFYVCKHCEAWVEMTPDEGEDGPDLSCFEGTLSADAQDECAHDRVSDQDVCLDCGLAFFYCHACSGAGGAERGIYHAKPLCGSEVAS